MALVFNRNRVGVENTSTTVGVPNDPIARLMYYLNCMCTVLSLDQMDSNIMRLINYEQYRLLSDLDKALLVVLVTKLNPITLTGKCLVHDEDVHSNAGRDNEFYNINAESMTFAATDSVIIGEKRVSVKKFMVYNMAWLNRNYILPLKAILDEDNQPNRNTQQTQSYQRPALIYNRPQARTHHHPVSYQRPLHQSQPSYRYHAPTSSSCCVIL